MAEGRMGSSPIPTHVREFIARHIDSVGEVEALLLLRASRQPMTAASIAERLYIGETDAVEILARLYRTGLLTCRDELYLHECRTEELQRLVDELAELYKQHLIPITNLIHAKSRRIRQFADAFRLRKDQ
jgi:adenylate cyclase